MQELSAANEPVSITVQGSGSMVAMTDTMYRALIAALARAEHAAGFGGVLLIDRLSAQFDDLVSAMNQPGTAQTALTTLFGDPAGLNETYAPGTTEH